MPDRDLSALIERVEQLSGPDRSVDAELHWLAYYPEHEFVAGKRPTARPRDIDWSGYDLLSLTEDRRYTASVDAVLALVERVLPGWACGFDRGPETCIAFVDPHDFANRFGGARYTATAPTPSLAILLALLRALEAKEGR